VFTVVSTVNGIVDSSNVASTGGPGASAQFSLRVPSALLQQALTDLSRLRFANVISRIDATRDVNGSFVSAQRRIALAEAALVRLRAKLAATTIQTEIASLRVQIAGEQATIAQARRSLRSLNRQVDYTRVRLSILATTTGPGSGAGGRGGFGLGRAGHDALRVLEVTAGVALIVLAALVPSPSSPLSPGGSRSPCSAAGASGRSTWPDPGRPRGPRLVGGRRRDWRV